MAESRELVLTRLIEAPREKLFRCWSEPELLKQWFCPPPWRVTHAEIDMRTGGESVVLMRGPNGEEAPNRGVYLEVAPNARIVFTDAFVKAWVPSEKAFMLGEITFDDEGGRTRYCARVSHWSVEDKLAHEAMGFHEGWGIATDQLEALAKTL